MAVCSYESDDIPEVFAKLYFGTYTKDSYTHRPPCFKWFTWGWYPVVAHDRWALHWTHGEGGIEIVDMETNVQFQH
jgi:hypothetical protein